MPSASDKAPHPFDEATKVIVEEGRRFGATSDHYWAFVGPFGGATAATILEAVLTHGERNGEPLALTVNYCAPVRRGRFGIDVRLVRANRSSQHWSVELVQDAEDGSGQEVVATATAITAERRPSFAHQVATMPEVVPSSALKPLVMDGFSGWTRQYDFRFASGLPRFRDPADAAPANPRSELWLSDHQPRRIDMLSLAAMADAFFGRIFHVRGGMVPFGTVSMTTYFHVDAAELAAEDTTELLGVADAQVFSRSYGDQTAQLWTPSGRLVATSQQITYFKV